MAGKKTAVAAKRTEEVKEVRTYKALISFYDKDKRVIKAGEDYLSDDEEWIEYLLSDRNKTGKPVIR